MNAEDLPLLSLHEASDLLQERQLSPVELTESVLERIERLEPRLHAYATVLPEIALEGARRAEEEIARGEIRGPLHGVPLAVKDLCAMKGVRTTCGTRVLADWKPDHTATVVERLVTAGAVILGKLQLTEGAFGWHHPDVTPPINPWGAEFWTGVSSSGSAVATAAGLCFGSLGSDTGGSIRFPSACCGLVGLKPTWGRVSRFGVFPLAHSLDHVGPMTRTVADAAFILGALAGHDPADPTSLRAAVPDYAAELGRDLAGLRLGFDAEYASRDVDPAVRVATEAVVASFASLGVDVRQVQVPPVDALLQGWFPFTAVECALAHAETFPSRADDYGPELRALLELGTGVPATDYARIEIERARFQSALADVFEAVDVLLVPSLPVPTPGVRGAEPEAIGNLLQFTAPFDFSGSPTLSLQGGFEASGAPFGFQLIGRHLEEGLLLRAGDAYQSSSDWHTRHPDLRA